jgi:hypothetical protein
VDRRAADVTIATKGGRMPLSNHEKRMLEAIEHELQNADPKLAKNLRAPAAAIRRRIKAAALLVSGLAVILSAIIFAPTIIPVLLIASILGFLLMLTGAVYGITGPRIPPTRPEDED